MSAQVVVVIAAFVLGSVVGSLSCVFALALARAASRDADLERLRQRSRP